MMGLLSKAVGWAVTVSSKILLRVLPGVLGRQSVVPVGHQLRLTVGLAAPILSELGLPADAASFSSSVVLVTTNMND
jgi:hypothetical protein